MAKDKLLAQARREVNVTTVKPQLAALARARTSGKQDFKMAEARVKQVTQALLGQLGQIPGSYAGQTAGIIPGVTNAIGALGTQLNANTIGAVPQAEVGAGNNMVHAIGAGAVEQIGSQQQGMADYLASAQHQGAVQGAVTSQNYLKDYENFLKENRQQRVDVVTQAHGEILTRLDQLREQKLQDTIAMKQLGMQQQQIDIANRQLDAQIKYMEDQLALRIKHEKFLRSQAVDPTRTRGAPETAPAGAETGPVPPSYWNAGANGNLMGAHHVDAGPSFGSVPSASISGISEYMSPEAALHWVSTLNPASDLSGARDAIVAWANKHGGPSILAPEGYIQAIMPPPDVKQVVDTFNQLWMQSIGGAHG